MTRAEIEYVRDTYSKKNRKGEFSPAWAKSFDEMAKKTVVRRHAKVLPMSSDLDDLVRRDDDLYDLDGRGDKTAAAEMRGKTLGDRLAMLAGDETPAHDPETGEIKEPAPLVSPAADAAPAQGTPQAAKSDPPAPSDAPKKDPPPEPPQAQEKAIAETDPLADLRAKGDAAAAQGEAALNAWLDNGIMPVQEAALSKAGLIKGWVEVAVAADKAKARGRQ
jgi:recombination protein RecT